MTPADQAEFDRHAAMGRTGLGEQAFTEAWAAGQALTLDEACAEAVAL